MKKKFTILIAALALLTMGVLPGRAVGQTYEEVLTLNCAYASENGSQTLYGVNNTTVMNAAGVKTFLKVAANESTTSGSDIVNGDATVSGSVYWAKGQGGTGIPDNVLKIGKASAAGSISFTLIDDYDAINKVSITGYGWKNTTAVSVNGSDSQTPSSAATEVTFDYVLSSATRTISIDVTISAFCVTEIVLYKESSGGSLTPSDLAITGAPVELNFDLYTSPSAQTVNYTTSSTGAVTVSGGTGYVTTVVDQENKTITVTPTAVTPSAQTITVNQAADATYAAGTATFTVNVTDSTPYTVTYDANGGTGTMTDTDSPYTSGSTVTVLDNEFTRDGYTFSKWNTAADGSGTEYSEGDTFTISANTTLYAQWTVNGGGGTQTLTFDVSSNPGGWPTTNPTTLTNYTYTLNDVDYTFALKNVKCNSGYLMITSVGVVGLPAIENYKLTKVVASNSGTCSTSTRVGISSSASSASYITGGAYQTWSSTSSSYTYNLSSTEANTMYYLYVTNKNAQVVELELTYEYVTPSAVATPTFSLDGGYYVGNQSVTISCETDGATIYYTTDGTTPSASNGTQGTSVSISSTTALKAIAIKDEDSSSVAEATYTILTPLTTMQAIFDANTTSTAKKVAITFGNWVITGNNGGASPSKAWLTDNNGKGCSLYQSSIGFTANNVLTGTVICDLARFGNSAQIQGVTSATTDINGNGIVASEPGSVTVVENVAISDLTGVNTGSVVQINNLTCTSASTVSFVLTDDNNKSITAKNTVYSQLALEQGKVYNLTGIYELSYTTNTIYPRSVNDVFEVVPSSPTITASPTSLTGFTYSEGNGPSTAKTISVSGTNLEGIITIGLGESSNFEISLSSDAGYTNSLTLTPEGGTVAATNVYVRMKADLEIANDYAGQITLTSTNATDVTVSLAGVVTGPQVTWDLSTASYDAGATANLVTWSSNYVTMTNAKGNSSTGANNYLGGGTHDHTRFYKDQVLTFTNAPGYAISSIEITATTSSYATTLQGCTWNNATASISSSDNKIVMVDPTNGNNPVSVTLKSVYVTSVTVFYEASSLTPHDITIDDMENGTVVANLTSAVAGATVTLTIYPAAGYYLDDDSDIEVDGVSGPCSLTKVNAGTFSFEMPDEDVTVYAIFSHYDDTYYTLVNSTADLIPGKHYIIASSKTAGPAKVMGGQDGNYRSAVDATVIGNTIYETVNVREVVLSGDDTNHWTLYDDATAYTGIGYLYAGNSILRGRPNNSGNDNMWSISITEGAATIVSQIEGEDVTNTIKYNPSQPRFSTYKPSSGMSLVYLYMKGNDSNSTYYSPTTVTDLNIESTEIYTVESGQILTVNGTLTNTNPANLIIEDGGQLIHDSDNVAATIQRKVNGYDTSKDGDNSGYELIASPVTDTLDVDTETNLTDDGEYDLYIFDQSKAQEEWRNYKKTPNPDFTTIENGKGYLYANSANVTIAFSGTLKPSDENVEIVLDYEDGHPFTGWNLVGNPFACNAYAFDTIGKSLAFYKMNAAGDDFEATTGPIAPMEGIFVYASATGKTFEFTRTAPASVPGKGNLNLEIAQVVTSRDAHKATDNAIIRFDGGSTLEKFSFSENNAKIYFPQNGKDYAVVSAEAQGEMPVYFKAAENGTYTISFSMDNVEFGYLHLIDNKTGNDVDLLQTPSYTFVASTIDYASRFRLVFRATGNDNDSENNDFGFFDANGNFLVLGIEGTATLQVIDVTGRILSTETFSGDYSKAINAKAGVYMLRLIQGSDVRTQKVVVK